MIYNKKKFQIVIFILLVNLVSCSHDLTGENFIQTSDAEFRGGIFQTEQWKTSMKFNRFTWMRHMNMNLDILVHRFDKSSKFHLWFGKDEYRDVEKCPQFFIFITYSNPSSNLTFPRLESQLLNQNFTVAKVLEFKENLKNHPAFLQHNLMKYSIHGFCQNNFSQNAEYLLNFPGYKQLSTTF